MLNFEVINPTRIVFGKEQLTRLPALVGEFAPSKKIMLAFGGGSIEKTGLLTNLLNALTGFEVVLFGGIEANPQYATLMKGVHLAREKNIEFILAVGGGSVIDGVKFMTGAFYYEGEAWDVLDRKPGCDFLKALPFGTVLTLPATGSEANSGAVISRAETKEKRAMGGPLFFPKFSFCDPSLIATLPKRQLANGITDAFMHTLEQYITYPTDNLLQERQAEGILLTLIEIAEKVIENPADYRLASNLMWSATHALNGNLRCGVPTDWVTHMIGHELTAIYGIDHARTLAIIAPRLYENQFETKKEKLAQYGKRVFQLTGTDEEIARKAIEATVAFYHTMGMKTKISENASNIENTADFIVSRFEERGWKALGERQNITLEKLREIVELSY